MDECETCAGTGKCIYCLGHGTVDDVHPCALCGDCDPFSGDGNCWVCGGLGRCFRGRLGEGSHQATKVLFPYDAQRFSAGHASKCSHPECENPPQWMYRTQVGAFRAICDDHADDSDVIFTVERAS